MPRPPIALAVFSVLAAVAGFARGQSLPKDSPFLPAAGTAAAGQATAPSYQFVGMTVVGKDTLLGITRQSDKRSVWIPVGKTVADITAVTFNPQTDTAVIRTDGQVLTLTMRHSTVAAGAATPPPAFASVPIAVAPPATPDTPAAAPAPAPPATQEEKETEARMLVTDLLEIGQRQRQAYEEAQRQAAARAASGKAPPADAVVTPKH